MKPTVRLELLPSRVQLPWGLEATPIFVIEDFLTSLVVQTCRAAGLKDDTIERAKGIPLRVAAVDFPLEIDAARQEAKRLLDDLRPTALIAVERPGWNEKGVYHPGAGIDFSSLVAKVDCLFVEARSRGILTIGIGDHGGEIGFGLIHDTAKRVLPLGSECRCPCKAGIAAATPADVVVVSSPPSNRGANGVEACLAALLGYEELLHDSALERRLVRACADAGGIDSTSGLAECVIDHVPDQVNASLIDILHEMVRPILYTDFFKRRHAEYWTEKLDSLKQRIENWRKLL